MRQVYIKYNNNICNNKGITELLNKINDNFSIQ